MIANNHEYFEELEIEHNLRTYYASGYVEYIVKNCIGGSYEDYDFELLYDTEVHNIIIKQLWYYDEESDEAVNILGQKKYKEIEKIAVEEIKYKFE